MILNEDFSFKRKFFIKDLLKADSLLEDASTLEYDCFEDFAITFLQDKLYSLDTIHKIIVPVDSPDEAKFLMDINPEARPFLIIYLRDFSKATRDNFHKLEKSAILCDSKQIASLKEAMINEPSESFVDFICDTYGYFRATITREDIDNISYIYTDAFFTLPVFCIADIRWDWLSFEDMPLKDLHGVIYHTRLIQANMYKQSRTLDWKLFGKTFVSGYSYDFMKVGNAKRPFIKGTKLYPDYMCLEEYAYDFYENKDKDPNKESLDYVDTIRSPFDVWISPAAGVDDASLVSVSQNILCNGNPAMIPYLCIIITRVLKGGRI